MPWEHGSILTLPSFDPSADAEPAPWAGAPLYGSGRAALVALLRHGRATHGWRRLLVPAYLCQEVVAAARREIPVVAYPDSPLSPAAAMSSTPDDLAPDESSFLTETGDAVLIVNTLGLRARGSLAPPPGVFTIEDHTHDPWSPWCQQSSADYALVALRKTLPLPDGGALWSPRGHALPGAPQRSTEHEALAERQLAAQLLKALYLRGHAIDKQTYLRLAAEAEAGIAEGEPVAMSRAGEALLPSFPALRWRERRRLSFEHGAEQLRAPLDELGHQLLLPAPGATSFGLTVCFASGEARDQVRRALIERAVYPAILWDLSAPALPLDERVVALSRRCFTLHCDYRSTPQDIDRVAEHLLTAARAC
ncbi:MAG: hypothetical protein KIT72_11415 [Polyangiaceae bacterium]|nr:hypothetical protein [Polyangiaceae bacterium]MCW5791021.1 hypothetical protein [Polyangiaceae bacterium]